MSLVENLVQQLSSNNGLGAVSKPQGFDMDDDTFAKLLKKTMDTQSVENNNSISQLGQPAGFMIEPLEGTDMEEQNKIQEGQTIDFKTTEPFEIKDLKLGDYLSSYLSDMSNSKSPIMDMAIRRASNAYNVFGKELISDIKEFAADIVKTM